MTPEHLASCDAKPMVWRKLLFSLSFFHAVMQVRMGGRHMGWLGQGRAVVGQGRAVRRTGRGEVQRAGQWCDGQGCGGEGQGSSRLGLTASLCHVCILST